jgi:N-acetyl-gamma-glutamyl-phosphate reductase
MKFPVGIVGFRGYSGAEALHILARHPHFHAVLLDHRAEAGIPTDTVRAVLLATPPEVSMDLAPKFLAAGAIVVDLSGAFRLKSPDRYKLWYKEDHTAPDLIAQAIYGLPEFNRDAVQKSTFISNPGCYPTAANLALRPLVAAGLIDRKSGIVCDAKSGVSGAGRKASLATSFCEVAENFSAYSILKHRHVPEVLDISGLEENEFSFTAQLIPVNRGILETIYFRLAPGTDERAVRHAYLKQYAREPFVRIYEPGKVPDLHAVQRTNFCDIGVTVDAASGRCVVVSAIDNLVKGAAGQAIQNLNLAAGFDETAGLLLKPSSKSAARCSTTPRRASP